MRAVYLLLILSLGLTLSCTTPRYSVVRNKNREMLKELFLYKCITRGYPEIEFDKLDHSAAVYFELSHYTPEAYLKIDSLAKDFVSNITNEDTYYEDEKSKGIFIKSMEYLKDKKLDDFIKELDKYMSKYSRN